MIQTAANTCSIEDELYPRPSDAALWSVERGASPIVGTAIHNGHRLRDDVGAALALDDAGRLREEDPFTEFVIRDVPNRVVFHRSRFEINLNRDRDGAVYVTPEQAWGLEVWSSTPSAALIAHSLAIHDAYYAMLGQMLAGLERDYGRFVLLDIGARSATVIWRRCSGFEYPSSLKDDSKRVCAVFLNRYYANPLTSTCCQEFHKEASFREHILVEEKPR